MFCFELDDYCLPIRVSQSLAFVWIEVPFGIPRTSSLMSLQRVFDSFLVFVIFLLEAKSNGILLIFHFNSFHISLLADGRDSHSHCCSCAQDRPKLWWPLPYCSCKSLAYVLKMVHHSRRSVLLTNLIPKSLMEERFFRTVWGSNANHL